MAFLKRTLFENHNQSSFEDDEDEDNRASSPATLKDVLAALPPLVSQSLETRRPILHHLNADTSWLLQLPRPDVGGEGSSGRRFYNIVFDPWLSGPQSDVASWFSRQWHVVPPALGSIAEVEQLCAESERLGSTGGTELTEEGRSYIDLVVISHEFTDHCHEQTLRQCDRSIPVLATTKAAPLIQKWKHFDTVVDMPGFKSGSGSDSDWRETAVSPLPPWLGVSRLVTGKDALYYHSAVMLAFNLDTDALSGKQSEDAEAVIYTPHGIQAQSLAFLPSVHPSIKTLALLHGLHDVSIDWGQQLNLGAVNGLEAQQALRARYWIGTHDEVKKGGGVVSWFLRRRVWTVDDAIAEEAKKKQQEKDQAERDKTKALLDGEYLDMKSGDSKVLA